MLLTVKDVMVIPGHDLQCSRKGGADVVSAVVSCTFQVTQGPCEVSRQGAMKAAADAGWLLHAAQKIYSDAVRCSTTSGLASCMQTAAPSAAFTT